MNLRIIKQFSSESVEYFSDLLNKYDTDLTIGQYLGVVGDKIYESLEKYTKSKDLAKATAALEDSRTKALLFLVSDLLSAKGVRINPKCWVQVGELCIQFNKSPLTAGKVSKELKTLAWETDLEYGRVYYHDGIVGMQVPIE